MGGGYMTVSIKRRTFMNGYSLLEVYRMSIILKK